MKKTLSILLAVLFLVHLSYGQTTTCGNGIPPPIGEGYLGGYPIQEVLEKTDLIFEGRVLSDSVVIFNPPGEYCTIHRILVLKQFKGNFKSDTIRVSDYDGSRSLAIKGDEYIFCVSTYMNSVAKINDPDFYWTTIGSKDFSQIYQTSEEYRQSVYANIEKATGHKYVERNPNRNEIQEAQKGLGYHQSKSNSSLVGILSAFDITATWLKLVFIFPSSILLIWLNSILARFANSCCEMPFSRRSSRIRAPHFFIKSISQVYFTPKIGIV